MLRADSALGRLVLALAVHPADLPPAPYGGPGARLIAALGARPVPEAVPEPVTEAVPEGPARAPLRYRPAAWGRWLPGLLTTWLVTLTCLTAAAVQKVLPGPWQAMVPGQAEGPGPERWSLTAAGRLGPRGRAEALAFTPDGRLLVTVSRSSAGTWDMADPGHPRQVAVPPGVGRVTAVGASPDGRTLVTAGGPDVRALAVGSGATRWSVDGAPREVKAVAAGRDRVVFADAGTAGSTRLTELRLDAGRPLRLTTLSRLQQRVDAAQFSADGHTLAVAGAEGTVRLWDVSDPRRPEAAGPAFGTPGLRTTALAFSPDARLLATVDAARTVRLWDVADRARPRPLGRPFGDGAERVTAVAFSPDARLVATVGTDGTTSLWWRLPGTEADVPPGATAR
ncbi:WD40 repeat domain-containing protein [Streptomyces sp. NPDC017248]|uniref:WD40 repeat domain-containing protein n=1 Tax=unclassified Streptomyces TaxID=2593676 RepID=UPI0037A127F7